MIHNLNVLPEKDLGKGIVGISVPQEVNMDKIKEIDYNITTSPSKALPFSVSSSNITIVKYANNKIQALKNGTSKIYVDLTVGSQTMRMESQVNVTNFTDPSTNIAITGITVNRTNVSLNENETVQLTVALTPSNHTMSKVIKWQSSNTNVAAVDSNGKITAIGVGTVAITATTVNGKSAKCTVTVNKTVTENEVLKHLGLTKKDGYIVGFQLGASVESVKKLLSSYPNVKLESFTDISGKEISSGIISTNMKFTLIINQKQYNYIVVVKGDVNGDGLIYATDYVCIKNYIMGKKKLEGAYLRAADINNDNNIYATDYVKIKNYIMGKGKIEQN